MKKLALLFILVLTLACHRTAPPSVNHAPKSVVSLPWRKVVGSTGWSFEIPNNWERFIPKTEIEGAWRNGAHTNMIAVDSMLFNGDRNDLYMEIPNEFEDAGLTVLKASPMKLSNQPGAAYVMAAGDLMLIKFVVVVNSRVYSLSCATPSDSLEDLKPACMHAVSTFEIK